MVRLRLQPAVKSVASATARVVGSDIDDDAATTATAVAQPLSILAKVAPLEAFSCSGVGLITDTNLAQS